MRYRILTGTLESRTAVHIGAGAGTEVSDSLLRRDTEGQVILPGTAIAGVLRSMLTRLAPRIEDPVCAMISGHQESCNCIVCRLMGDVNPTDEGQRSSTASKLLVFNAICSNEPTHVRDGVGISRHSRTAARSAAAKYDAEILPAGTAFSLRIELRNTAPDEESLLAAAIAEWEAGRLWLGAGKARGLGAFSLRNIALKDINLSDVEQLTNFLATDRPWEGADTLAAESWLQTSVAQIKLRQDGDTEDYVANSWLAITGLLNGTGLLLTNDASVAGIAGFDNVPLTSGRGNWDKPVLAGSGLRGVIRAHAERIARTMATRISLQQAHGSQQTEWFLAHCPACDPNARRTGAQPPPEHIPYLESCDSLLLYEAGKSGNDFVPKESMCLSCRLFGSTRWGSRLIIEDAPYSGDLPPQYIMRDFVAIDRFTGGSADKLKFDALALFKPSFELRIFLENPEPWELGWLWLVLRDLKAGHLSVGYGASKGFGAVELNNLKIRMGYLPNSTIPELFSEQQALKNGIFDVFCVTDSDSAWATLQREGGKQFRDAVLGTEKMPPFTRHKTMQPDKDSYFRTADGHWLPSLYPFKETSS